MGFVVTDIRHIARKDHSPNNLCGRLIREPLAAFQGATSSYHAALIPRRLGAFPVSRPEGMHSVQSEREALFLVRKVGFEPTKSETADLQSTGFNHSPTCTNSRPFNVGQDGCTCSRSSGA